MDDSVRAARGREKSGLAARVHPTVYQRHCERSEAIPATDVRPAEIASTCTPVGLARLACTPRNDAAECRRGRRYSGLISTLRNFTTPAPYCSAMLPFACWLSLAPSTVLGAVERHVEARPLAVIS